MSSGINSQSNDAPWKPRGLGVPASSLLTVERLRECLIYDPNSGVFRWVAGCASKRHVGHVAGSPDSRGYRIIKLDQVCMKAHRLAWIYVNGSHPLGEIDHINGIKDDNRIVNLRDVPLQINRQNQRIGIGETGLLGVSRSDKPGTFRATIKVNRKQIRLGVFPSPEAAHAAYVEAKRRLHPGGML